jgi:mono/diheme cytochrome c family protein
MRRTLPILAMAALLGACATEAGAAGKSPDPAVERGLRFAQRSCAGCHAIAPDGESRRTGAPNFGQLRMRYTSPALEKRLADISRHGHLEMPPVFITQAEARDVAEYIESLGGK